MSKVAKGQGFSVTPHVGDGAVLLAFNLEKKLTTHLAGFTIQCHPPTGAPYFLKNRLNFQKGLTNRKKLASTDYVGSDQAPFQKFQWIHFPPQGPGVYQYIVYATYFKNGALKPGPKITVTVDLRRRAFSDLELGFTRAYISAQAYVDRYKNKDIRPYPKSMDFDTTPYQDQYQWLGAHARKLVFQFLDECLQDPLISVDVFAYDFDEPDIIRALCKMGSRVRVFQDDSALHTGSKALEPKTVATLKAAGVRVKLGHFDRFAHNKVMIQKKNGKATKVLTGSANFSVRGLYVQANSILVFNDPIVANLYEQAFEQAFTHPDQFKSSSIAARWYNLKRPQSFPLSLSFAPHPTPFTLHEISKAIESARSSVLFAVMQMGGQGKVLRDLENLGEREQIFSLGIIESTDQLRLFKPGIGHAEVASFDFLQGNLPGPFKPEWSGGVGEVIHHKFIVCDFNDRNPVVFCGSSNLAQGGETSNGDNLIAIYNREIATCYAVEAVRLFDHYRFRNLHEKSTTRFPLILKSTDEWVKPYYDPASIKFRERELFSRA
jgi:hypothetical protein